MPTTTFNYTPPGTLVPFFHGQERLRFVRGPIGSTKSTAMTMELFRRACEQAPGDDGVRRTRFAVVRNTLPQIRDTCLVTIQKTLKTLPAYKVSTHTIQFDFQPGDGTRVVSDWLCLPLDTPDNIRKLLSLELTGAWVSEFREIEPEIVINVFSRTGRYPSALAGGRAASWYGVIAESNSFDEDSPWFDKLEINRPANWGYYVQPGAFDEGADWLQYLTPTYYSDFMESNTENWIKQYVHNIIGPSVSGQAVFADSFHYDTHVSQKELLPLPGRHIVIGLDVGRNPGAVIGQMDARGKLLILHALWAENVGIEKFIAEHIKPVLYERFPSAALFCVLDPIARNKSQIGEESILEVVNAQGLHAILASTNNIAPRLRAVESYLTRVNGILIDRVFCGELIRALQYKYRFKRDTGKNLGEIPEKGHPESDLADALQYLCLGVESRTLARRVTPVHDQMAPTRIPREAWT